MPQVFGTMLRTKTLQKYDFDDTYPWSGLLSSVAWAIYSTHHTTLQVTPGQLVFGREMLLNLQYVADWEAIRLKKQKDLDTNNNKENSIRTHHYKQVGDHHKELYLQKADLSNKRSLFKFKVY